MAVSPILGQDLPYDGQPNVVTVIAAFLLALESAALAPASARVYHNTTQSIPDAAVTALVFNSERFDTAAIHSTSSNTSRLTAPSAGKYLIFCALSWVSNGTGYRQAIIRLNGSTLLAIDSKNTISGDTTKHAISTVYELAESDYVELCGYQTSGGALNVDSTGSFSCEFGMTRIGD